MAGIEQLARIVQREVADYACPSANPTAYYVESAAERVYAVLVVPHQHPQKTTVMIMARLSDDKVIIETDKTDHSLYEALTQVGIPPQQIVLAYSGAIEPLA